MGVLSRYDDVDDALVRPAAPRNSWRYDDDDDTSDSSSLASNSDSNSSGLLDDVYFEKLSYKVSMSCSAYPLPPHAVFSNLGVNLQNLMPAVMSAMTAKVDRSTWRSQPSNRYMAWMKHAIQAPTPKMEQTPKDWRTCLSHLNVTVNAGFRCSRYWLLVGRFGVYPNQVKTPSYGKCSPKRGPGQNGA